MLEMGLVLKVILSGGTDFRTMPVVSDLPRGIETIVPGFRGASEE